MLQEDLNPPSVLFGAGRQAAHVMNLMEWLGLAWKDIVLFDDAYPQRRTGPRDMPILGRLEEGIEYATRGGHTSMVALGSTVGALRYSTYRSLMKANVPMANLIHPSCVIAPSAVLGRNLLVMPGCVVGPHTEIGSVCCMFAGVIIEHDSKIGENVVFGPGVVVSGCAKIGNHAFLGAGSVCAPEVTLGAAALLGAGAVAASDIPDGVVAVGVPARVIRQSKAGDDVPLLQEVTGADAI